MAKIKILTLIAFISLSASIYADNRLNIYDITPNN